MVCFFFEFRGFVLAFSLCMVRCCNQLRHGLNDLVTVVGLVTAYDMFQGWGVSRSKCLYDPSSKIEIATYILRDTLPHGLQRHRFRRIEIFTRVLKIGDLTSCYYNKQVPFLHTTETQNPRQTAPNPSPPITGHHPYYRTSSSGSKLPSGNASHIRYFDPMLQRFIRGM